MALFYNCVHYRVSEYCSGEENEFNSLPSLGSGVCCCGCKRGERKRLDESISSMKTNEMDQGTFWLLPKKPITRLNGEDDVVEGDLAAAAGGGFVGVAGNGFCF